MRFQVRAGVRDEDGSRFLSTSTQVTGCGLPVGQGQAIKVDTKWVPEAFVGPDGEEENRTQLPCSTEMERLKTKRVAGGMYWDSGMRQGQQERAGGGGKGALHACAKQQVET